MILAIGMRVRSFKRYSIYKLGKSAPTRISSERLTTWKGSRVRKGDIQIAKNYLTEDEIDSLNRLTVIFLGSAELRVKSKKDLTLGFWRNNVDALLEFNDYPSLSGAGNRSKKQMEHHTSEQYSIYDRLYKKNIQKKADKQDLAEIEKLSKVLKSLK